MGGEDMKNVEEKKKKKIERAESKQYANQYDSK
jgi:hypothetical protein